MEQYATKRFPETVDRIFSIIVKNIKATVCKAPSWIVGRETTDSSQASEDTIGLTPGSNGMKGAIAKAGKLLATTQDNFAPTSLPPRKPRDPSPDHHLVVAAYRDGTQRGNTCGQQQLTFDKPPYFI